MRITEEKFNQLKLYLYSRDDLFIKGSSWIHKSHEFKIEYRYPHIYECTDYDIFLYTLSFAEITGWLYNRTFEKFLDNLPPDLQEDFLFHLDLFT